MIEKKVDHLIAELEAERDLSQVIVHVDMDAFFANVELLHNPELKGKAFGVGKGVLTTASYEARKFGVRSGMAGFVAKKLCPELIFVKINFSRYSEMSKKVMDVFRQYDPNMAPAGCDEGYLNITQHCQDNGLTPDECVEQMREVVFKKTSLTVSAGIAPNKMLAKICSDKNKPNGQFHLPFSSPSVREFMRDLPIRKIPGIGRVSERLLDSIGIKTCGNIYDHRAILFLLDKQFGLHFMLRTYLGIASNVVIPHQREERKSIGAERTFSPIENTDAIVAKLEEVAEELESDMADRGWAGRTVTLKYKLHTYQVFTRARSIGKWITKKEDLLAIGKELLQPELPLKIRLIGLRVTKLRDLRDTSSGIKRFFEPVSSNAPNKRRKLDSQAVIDVDVATDTEDVMLGYFEEEDERMSAEAMVDADEEMLEGAEDNTAEHQSRPLNQDSSDSASRYKPQSTTGQAPPSTSSRPHTSTSSRPPTSTSTSSRPPNSASKPHSQAADERAQCPVCNKTLMSVSATDNQGLNAHIDFCLSRSAIVEAQGQASIGSQPVPTTTTNKNKVSNRKAPKRKA